MSVVFALSLTLTLLSLHMNSQNIPPQYSPKMLIFQSIYLIGSKTVEPNFVHLTPLFDPLIFSHKSSVLEMASGRGSKVATPPDLRCVPLDVILNLV